jgi:hypothetical protein
MLEKRTIRQLSKGEFLEMSNGQFRNQYRGASIRPFCLSWALREVTDKTKGSDDSKSNDWAHDEVK